MADQDISYHYPVMLKEVSAFVEKKIEENKEHGGDGIIIFDGTLGHGGHLKHLFELFGLSIKLYVATDADLQMFEAASQRLEKDMPTDQYHRISLHHCTYNSFGNILNNLNKQGLDSKYDVVFLDLGVNLRHFKLAERGFSIKGDGQLDMRYNASSELEVRSSKSNSSTSNFELGTSNSKTGADIINTYSEQQLIDMFVINSEISRGTSQKLAAEIVRMRQNKLFQTSTELNNLTKKLGYSARVAAIVFQAVRIEVNQEFQNIKYVLEHAQAYMNPGGILIILSYHSGEDRIVKDLMKKLQDDGEGKILTKHTQKPSYQEVMKNRPSRSAQLRVFQYS